MARWRRRIEANVDLCLNYVREIAKNQLTEERIRDIESEHKRREEEIAQTDPDLNGGDDEDDDEHEVG